MGQNGPVSDASLNLYCGTYMIFVSWTSCPSGPRYRPVLKLRNGLALCQCYDIILFGVQEKLTSSVNYPEQHNGRPRRNQEPQHLSSPRRKAVPRARYTTACSSCRSCRRCDQPLPVESCFAPSGERLSYGRHRVPKQKKKSAYQISKFLVLRVTYQVFAI